jgi:hypothetical protein
MALQATTTTVYNLTATNAYHRVENVRLDKVSIAFSMVSYSEHLETMPFPFNTKTYSCVYDINGENPIKQAYLYLKTLPEFLNATDC